MRPLRLVLFAGVLAIGGISLAIARDEPGFAFAGSSAAGAAALLGAGLALAGCGLASWSRQPGNRTGPLLLAAGAAWLLAEWNNPGSGSALAFSLGLL